MMKCRAAHFERTGNGGRRIDRVFHRQHVVLRIIFVAMDKQTTPMRSGNELHGTHFDSDVMQREPDTQCAIVELRLPIGMILMPRSGPTAGLLLNHVTPTAE